MQKTFEHNHEQKPAKVPYLARRWDSGLCGLLFIKKVRAALNFRLVKAEINLGRANTGVAQDFRQKENINIMSHPVRKKPTQTMRAEFFSQASPLTEPITDTTARLTGL